MNRTIALATQNPHKLLEIKHMLGDLIDFNAVKLDLPEIQGTPEEVARAKALSAFDSLKRPVLVEDTSLHFNAFRGLPGPYIKWFEKALGPKGLNRLLADFSDKSGYAQTIVAYMDGRLDDPLLFIGKTTGTIVSPRDKSDDVFGWDSCFLPDGESLTYGEMKLEQKNAVSQRAKALRALKEHFMKHA